MEISKNLIDATGKTNKTCKNKIKIFLKKNKPV